jgi:hypothetical protein
MCRANLQGGCEAQCTDPKGALFCDGQYVDAGSRLEECLNYLEDILKIDVEGYARADCQGNTCTAEAGGSISCTAAPATNAPFDGRAAAFAALGLGLLVARRRKH